jgi:hypothetical protein
VRDNVAGVELPVVIIGAVKLSSHTKSLLGGVSYPQSHYLAGRQDASVLPKECESLRRAMKPVTKQAHGTLPRVPASNLRYELPQEAFADNRIEILSSDRCGFGSRCRAASEKES